MQEMIKKQKYKELWQWNIKRKVFINNVKENVWTHNEKAQAILTDRGIVEDRKQLDRRNIKMAIGGIGTTGYTVGYETRRMERNTAGKNFAEEIEKL